MSAGASGLVPLAEGKQSAAPLVSMATDSPRARQLANPVSDGKLSLFDIRHDETFRALAVLLISPDCMIADLHVKHGGISDANMALLIEALKVNRTVVALDFGCGTASSMSKLPVGGAEGQPHAQQAFLNEIEIALLTKIFWGRHQRAAARSRNSILPGMVLNPI
ncbi:hypothetical protein KTQ42_14040|uniref:hypothetical protein n=1 Tax=Noviherbaspirillum sp. L7-7A TaxID=2850560 RepID=UPI001C2BEBF9|nr:hypothetical protein [Noviherbaspirillum sp. L7-7A]MBV0880429.1 hypothetical protein [Noviherbaspirillum sp. L7-7A]